MYTTTRIYGESRVPQAQWRDLTILRHLDVVFRNANCVLDSSRLPSEADKRAESATSRFRGNA